MASNTTTHEKDSGIDLNVLLTTLIAYRRGDFTVRMPNDWTGMHGKIADTLNDIIDMTDRTTSDFERVSKVVGKAGRSMPVWRLTIYRVRGPSWWIPATH